MSGHDAFPVLGASRLPACKVSLPYWPCSAHPSNVHSPKLPTPGQCKEDRYKCYVTLSEHMWGCKFHVPFQKFSNLSQPLQIRELYLSWQLHHDIGHDVFPVPAASWLPTCKVSLTYGPCPAHPSNLQLANLNSPTTHNHSTIDRQWDEEGQRFHTNFRNVVELCIQLPSEITSSPILSSVSASSRGLQRRVIRIFRFLTMPCNRWKEGRVAGGLDWREERREASVCG